MSAPEQARLLAQQTLALVFQGASRHDLGCYAMAVALGFPKGACGMDLAEASQWFEVPPREVQARIAAAREAIHPGLQFG
jgi:hypothetical protein